MKELDDVKWEMLEEWSRTKRAPKQAAWMHERELAAVRQRCTDARTRIPNSPTGSPRSSALGVVKRHPVVIVGAGPIGLTAALECASRGIPAVLLDDNNTSASARAPSATPSARWRSGTGSVSARRWRARA